MTTPRRLRPVQPPLGLCFRPGPNDHRALLQPLSEGNPSFSGVVLSAARYARHEELGQEVRKRHMEVVLDPHTVELATPNGFERPALASLPWAGHRIHRPDDFQGASVVEVSDRIAKLTVEKGFNAVLAPTHYIESSHDPWLGVDRRLTLRLRRQLDFGGHDDTPIYYPLVLPRKLLIDADQRSELIGMLMQLPIDAVWLRVHPFGSNSGATSLRSYIDASQDFQQLGIPVIAERTGTICLALMAFGAVGGIERGVTTGERFDMGTLTRPQKADGKGFSPAPRVYIDSLGTFLKREQAKAFFAARGAKTHFACQDPKCCRRGWQSMVEDPRRHFFYSRVGEVGRLSEAPAGVRPGLYLEEFLRPATDLSLRAAKIDPALEKTKSRLESWRQTLGGMQRAGTVATVPAVPEGRRIVGRLLA